MVPHRTPTQACFCTPRDQRYTKETALKSVATRAPGENWFSQSTGGGGTSLGVTHPKVTRTPALQNHSLRARAEKHSGNPAGPQLVLRPHQMENQRSPEEFHL